MIEMYIVRPRRRGRLTGTLLDRSDRPRRTKEMWLGRHCRPGRTAKMYLVRLSRGSRTTETQPHRPARMMGMYRDRLSPRGRTMVILISLFHRRGRATVTCPIQLNQRDLIVETFLDRSHRPDRSIGTYLADRKARIGMMSVNGTKKTRGARSRGARMKNNSGQKI